MRFPKPLVAGCFLLFTGCVSRTAVQPTSLTAFNSAETVDGRVGGAGLMGATSAVRMSSRVQLRTTSGRIISVPSDDVSVYVTTTVGKEDVYWAPIQVHFIDGKMQIAGSNGSGTYGRNEIKKVEVQFLKTGSPKPL